MPSAPRRTRRTSPAPRDGKLRAISPCPGRARVNLTPLACDWQRPRWGKEVHHADQQHLQLDGDGVSDLEGTPSLPDVREGCPRLSAMHSGLERDEASGPATARPDR